MTIKFVSNNNYMIVDTIMSSIYFSDYDVNADIKVTCTFKELKFYNRMYKSMGYKEKELD